MLINISGNIRCIIFKFIIGNYAYCSHDKDVKTQKWVLWRTYQNKGLKTMHKSF
jgi:hypothetical protein